MIIAKLLAVIFAPCKAQKKKKTQHDMQSTVVASSTVLSVRYLLATLALVVEFTVCRLLYAIPLFHVVVEKKILKKARIKMAKENYWHSLFGWQMFKECWKMKIMDLRKRVCEGSDAVDSPLVTADGTRDVRLLDLVRPGRPLVVNFGSSS